MRRLILLLFTLQSVLVFAPVGAQGIVDYRSAHHPVYGKHGMVAAQNLLAAEIGADVLADGGNAVDAAVAVGFALAVALPRAGNIGGGGFMLVYDADSGETMAIDYREMAPLGADSGYVFLMRTVTPIRNCPAVATSRQVCREQ